MDELIRTLLSLTFYGGLILVAVGICLYARYLGRFIGFWYAVLRASAAEPD